MCPECNGTGMVAAIDIEQLVDKNKSLNEGAIQFPLFAPGTWYWKYFTRSGFFDNDKKIKDYSEEERHALLYRDDNQIKSIDKDGKRETNAWNPLNSTAEDAAEAKYEGLVPKFERIFLKKDASRFKGERKEAFERIVTHVR